MSTSTSRSNRRPSVRPPASGRPPSSALKPEDVDASAEELIAFHDLFQDCFSRREQRHWSLFYLCGQLSNIARKTIEPMVLALHGADPNAAIRSWWLEVGRQAYPGQHHLLIQADDGGSNDSRSWLWKAGLQDLADECQLIITVTHFPAGASKWNLIEHCLFCFISLNWAGQPLVSYETVLKFIRTTRTATGLSCRARLDRKQYETGLNVSAAEKASINLKPHRLFPNWNYTIEPRVSVRNK
jgi:Rhodopirellula transposase DDE domain